MAETWYVHPDDLIGGWCVMNRDYPPSQLDYGADPDARQVADFIGEADARRIVELHNADLAGRLLPGGGETREEWGVHWHMGDSDAGIAATRYQLLDRAEAVKHGASRVGIHCVTGYSVHRREHRIFEDGSSWTGPWVEVPDA